MRFQRIQSQLKTSFTDHVHLEIVDESHQHAGRQGQESHFKVVLVCPTFDGQSRVQRQRKINQLLKDEFEGGLHALSMRLLTPEEWKKQLASFTTPDCQGS